MPPKSKLVVILGAGASQAVGLPGTIELSEAVLDSLRYRDGYPDLSGVVEERLVRNIKATWPPRVEPLIDSIRRAGSENFETDMQVLESLMTLAPHDPMERVFADLRRLAEPRDAIGRGRIRPPVANLLQVLPLFPALTHRETLLELMHQLVATVRSRLETAEAEEEPTAADRVVAFFGSLAAAYDCSFYSFNYDGTGRKAAARALGPLVDGFTPAIDEVFERFDVRRFLDSPGPRYAHLHGALDFRIRPREVQRPVTYEVVKFACGVAVPPGFVDIQEAATQAGDFAMVGSMITGLHKADKTRTEPYGTYAYALERDLCSAERVLFIGYGGGDTYFNFQIVRTQAYHRALWKPAVITHQVPRPTEVLYALCGVMAGLEAPELNTTMSTALGGGGVAAVGALKMDVRGWRLENAEQVEWIVRALA